MPVAPQFTDAELLAYIAESLEVLRSVELEQCLRRDSSLRQRVAQLLTSQDAGGFHLGDTWRRRRLACPTRSTWAAYDAGRIGGEFQEYLRFHLEMVGCRYCRANLDDLQSHGDPTAAGRVRKFFETSVGRLRDLPEP